MRHITHWIDGKAADASGARTGAVFDPATGRQVAEVEMATAAVVDRAVKGAAAAGVQWGRMSLTRRMAVLFRFRQLLDDGAGELAAIVTAEHGKVRSDAAGEVARGLEVVEFACGVAELLKADHSVDVSTGVDAYTLRQPLGVVAGITPFNFPAMVPLWMAPLAIACGNSFVLKPSERDPSASVWLAERWADAGLPEGVLQVVHGDKEAVDAVVAHPQVQAVSFVGSTPVARAIYQHASAAGKRVQALGGAKNHLVVMGDADPDVVADALVNSAYGSAGERCMAVSVAVVVGDGTDALVEKVADRGARLVVGPGDAPASEMGPLVTRAHLDKVRGYVEAGVQAGAQLVLDGRQHGHGGDPAGFWLGPTLFDGVRPDMTIYRDEIFGPVLCVMSVGSLDEAIALVNANPYGNGAAIFTNDMAAARRFEVEVEAGMVGVNVPIPVPMAYYGFGGWGASIFGDHDIYGPDGVRFYTRAKKVTARPLAHRGSLSFPTNQ
ncbi:MAG: CoA-acylating methylmalonate-semialdehyde dehydrogenase [Actinomycetota bacterium]|jgi:malonate-semialdehyde dehydrogenase (acetylating)/methylmalonate-semialdehyde dehydrogenase|nr:CoA-acylating methylmalonate-semialdehyde dehydrogenase [Actinomycetota bacterium]MDA8076160.1 CoA-acylating methylmalonate-semialdehyde dehydrogenase [Actinomycetota bacterium]